MKKEIKRVGVLGLACVLGCSTLALSSCNNGGIPDDKSILNIKIFNGGLGKAWIDEIAADFMDTFKDVSFEDGKKGVYISITPSKAFTDIQSGMASGSESDDIFYTATADLNPFLNEKVAYDVTSLMTKNVYDASGNVVLAEDGKSWKTQKEYDSLADRISVDYYKDAFNLGTVANPSYYSIPYEDSLSGIIVDWDLFKAEGWNDYEGLDGMPDTIDDFYDLLGRIQRAKYSAFTYSMSVGYYTPAIQRAVQAKVDGTDWYVDAYSDYTGSYDFDGNGSISEDEKFTPNDSYRLLDTKGVKAAVDMGIEMFYKDMNGQTYYDPNVVQGVSYGGAQQDFIMSKTSTNRKRIAMILEGEWWENEARGTFNSMGRENEANAYGKREFRMMPIPHMTESDKTEKYTIGSFSNGCFTVVNQKTVGKNSVKQKLVELWLQYQYSANGLRIFTKHSGSVLPFDYEMSESDLKELTPFARNIWNLHHSDKVEIVYDNPMMRSNEVRLGTMTYNYSTKLNGETYKTGNLFNNLATMSQNNKTTTVADFIKGMHTYYDEEIKKAYPAK